ncbi:cellulose binding domain-containing protein [Streptomyces graminofaciens]|uniref:cellulose binding domain-containing protein n=1 Tax=Streptomyces graminofaciens TaxID=68212 RepID=UPI003D9AF867
MTLANTGPTAIDGWSLLFTLPGGQTITSAWNADYSATSGRVTARNVSHNATIAPGASVDIGFQAAHTGDTPRRARTPSTARPAPLRGVHRGDQGAATRASAVRGRREDDLTFARRVGIGFHTTGSRARSGRHTAGRSHLLLTNAAGRRHTPVGDVRDAAVRDGDAVIRLADGGVRHRSARRDREQGSHHSASPPWSSRALGHVHVRSSGTRGGIARSRSPWRGAWGG